MIPRLSLRERILAWLIWRYEGFDDYDMDLVFTLLNRPSLLSTRGLLLDYWYIRKARESGDA